jgi:hypothetical protein
VLACCDRSGKFCERSVKRSPGIHSPLSNIAPPWWQNYDSFSSNGGTSCIMIRVNVVKEYRFRTRSGFCSPCRPILGSTGSSNEEVQRSFRGRDSAVGVVTRLLLLTVPSGDPFPEGTRYFSLCKIVQIDSEAHPASYSVGTAVL